MSPLPSELAHAITHAGGGRVVLVVGAGVSIEQPTGLPSGRTCAIEAHRRLVADGVLDDGACAHPDDLSLLADTVVQVSGSQAELVSRLPREQFVGAQPNDGHLLAAALLRERAISAVLTLNFDLAFSNALVQVGAATDVAQVRGPEDQASLAMLNLVYLHRTANHPPDEWILRSDALTAAWTDSWEQAIASRVLTTPVVVFAGLGSPAAVLTDTTRKLRTILASGVRVFQVDVIPYAESGFASDLGLSEGEFLQVGWVAFMKALASRFLKEQLEAVLQACAALATSNGWPSEDVSGLCGWLADRGLLDLGRARSRWMLEDTPYLPGWACDIDHLADVLLVVRLIERQTGSVARILPSGLVEFWIDDRLRWVVALASARGKWTWTALEPRVQRARGAWGDRDGQVRNVVVAGGLGPGLAEVTAPASIVAGDRTDDIISGNPGPNLLDAARVRNVPPAELEVLLSA